MYYNAFTYPYYVYPSVYNANRQPLFWNSPVQQTPMYRFSEPVSSFQANPQMNRPFQDYGKQPYVVDIEDATKQNRTFRTAIWTGSYLQVTLMSINVGDEIGLEIHPDTDQFLRIEQGQGIVKMGDTKDQMTFEHVVEDDDAIMVPAGKWHNVINTGNVPLKLYSIYAPPHHPFGTVHATKADAIAAEQHERD